MKQDLKFHHLLGVRPVTTDSTKNVTLFFDLVLRHHSIFKPEVGFTVTVLIPEVTFFFFCQIVGVKKWIQ